MPEDNEVSGIVKWFDYDKGYGFLQTLTDGPDIFIHKKHLNAAGIKRPLVNKEPVTFSFKPSEKGLIVSTIKLG